MLLLSSACAALLRLGTVAGFCCLLGKGSSLALLGLQGSCNSLQLTGHRIRAVLLLAVHGGRAGFERFHPFLHGSQFLLSTVMHGCCFLPRLLRLLNSTITLSGQ